MAHCRWHHAVRSSHVVLVLCSSYESFNYDFPENQLFEHRLSKMTHTDVVVEEFLRWCERTSPHSTTRRPKSRPCACMLMVRAVAFAIAVVTGFVGFYVHNLTILLEEFKYTKVDAYIEAGQGVRSLHQRSQFDRTPCPADDRVRAWVCSFPRRPPRLWSTRSSAACIVHVLQYSSRTSSLLPKGGAQLSESAAHLRKRGVHAPITAQTMWAWSR